VVSLDSDFLGSGPGYLCYARQWWLRRRVRGEQTSMSRLYVAEQMPTPTGTKADHRFPLRASEIEELAWAIAAGFGIAGAQAGGGEIGKWAHAIAGELQKNNGA